MLFRKKVLDQSDTFINLAHFGEYRSLKPKKAIIIRQTLAERSNGSQCLSFFSGFPVERDHLPVSKGVIFSKETPGPIDYAQSIRRAICILVCTDQFFEYE